MSQQKYPKAYEAYQQAVYRDGRNPTFWCSIGVLYYQINQYRDALDAYSRAIRLNPYISEVWYDLGTLVSLIVPQRHICLRITADHNHSTNLATTRSMMLSMRISVQPSWIQRMFISKLACSCFATARLMAWLRSPTHQLPKTSIQTRINLAEPLAHQDHNGVPRRSNKLGRLDHHQEHLPRITGAITDWPTSIRQPSHQDNSMTVMRTEDRHSRHRHASLAQGKSNRCVLTLSLLVTTLQHTAAHLLHVITTLYLVHTPPKDKAHHRLSRSSYKQLHLPTVHSVCRTLTMAAEARHRLPTLCHPRLMA